MGFEIDDRGTSVVVHRSAPGLLERPQRRSANIQANRARRRPLPPRIPGGQSRTRGVAPTAGPNALADPERSNGSGRTASAPAGNAPTGFYGERPSTTWPTDHRSPAGGGSKHGSRRTIAGSASPPNAGQPNVRRPRSRGERGARIRRRRRTTVGSLARRRTLSPSPRSGPPPRSGQAHPRFRRTAPGSPAGCGCGCRVGRTAGRSHCPGTAARPG